jgi:hypothetical protein
MDVQDRFRRQDKQDIPPINTCKPHLSITACRKVSDRNFYLVYPAYPVKI